MTVIFSLWILSTGKTETISWQERYSFQVDRKEPGIYKTPCITTEGVIDSITVNWEFEGEVDLEVSADGGRHYCAIVNGVPKKDGFVSGRTLCCRTQIKNNSYLKGINISYTDSSGVMGSFGNKFLRGFLYRKMIMISGSNRMVYNYPVKIEVENVDGPVRFTAADKETLLKHYFQDINNDGASAYWVKLPQIPQEGSVIYIYYGNVQAVDLSSGEEVFEFFDGFNGDSLDEDRWDYLPEINGSLEVKNGSLTLKDSALVSRQPILQDRLRLEFKSSLNNSTSDIQANVGEISFYSSAFPEAEHVIAKHGEVKVSEEYLMKTGVDYLYSAEINSPNILFSRENNQDDMYSGEDCAISFKNNISMAGELFELKSASPYGTKEEKRGANFDWVRLRKIVYPEPVILSVSRQRLANLVQVIPEGYISQNISVPFPVRIVKAYDFPDEAELIISTDGRKNYLRNVESEKYYYASKGDFVAGRNLRWKVNTQKLTAKGKQLKKISIDYFPGSITLILPTGGDIFSVGEEIEINWSAQEYEDDYPLCLEYSVDEGKTYPMIAERVANSGIFYWHPEGNLKGKVLIKISDYYNAKIFDVLSQNIYVGERK